MPPSRPEPNSASHSAQSGLSTAGSPDTDHLTRPQQSLRRTFQDFVTSFIITSNQATNKILFNTTLPRNTLPEGEFGRRLLENVEQCRRFGVCNTQSNYGDRPLRYTIQAHRSNRSRSQEDTFRGSQKWLSPTHMELDCYEGNQQEHCVHQVTSSRPMDYVNNTSGLT